MNPTIPTLDMLVGGERGFKATSNQRYKKMSEGWVVATAEVSHLINDSDVLFWHFRFQRPVCTDAVHARNLCGTCRPSGWLGRGI